jgi:protein-S-isoprenylcysteine O-methyltransferase Ste14
LSSCTPAVHTFSPKDKRRTMTIAQVVVPACWLTFLLYWVGSARSVKPTQGRPRGPGRYWHYILLIVGAILVQHLPIGPLNVTLVPRSAIVSVLSSLCAVGGLAIALIARRTLADNWSAVVSFKRDHELVTRGIYHYMRHPIYTGVLLLYLATVLLVGTLGAALGFLIVFIGLWVKLKQEEALMERHFPREYPAYKDRTKALIPYML